MNAHCERFNRTIQEEFIDYYQELLFTDLEKFNEKLADWLVWYNQDRPHFAQGQISPIQTMLKLNLKCNRLDAYNYFLNAPRVIIIILTR